MLKLCLSLALALMALVNVPVCLAEARIISQITASPDIGDFGLRLNGMTVVWHTCPYTGASTVDYYYLDSGVGGTIAMSEDSDPPSISAEWVAWAAGPWGGPRDIFVARRADFSTSFLTCSWGGMYDLTSPIVSGPTIAWVGEDLADDSAYYVIAKDTSDAELNMCFEIFGPSSYIQHDVFHELIVWSAYDEGSDLEIFSYFTPTSELVQLTDNFYDDIDVRIHEDLIVWSQFDGNDYEIVGHWVFDPPGLDFQITNNGTDDSNPETRDGLVVWQGFDGEDWEIFLWEGLSPHQITDNGIDDAGAQVFYPLVVWTAYDGTDWEVHKYDIPLQVAYQVTNNDYWDSEPQTNGIDIVWAGSLAGEPCEQYDLFRLEGAIGTVMLINPSDFADCYNRLTATPGGFIDTVMTITNNGDVGLPYFIEIEYLSGSGWIFLPTVGYVDPGGGFVEVPVTFEAPLIDGLYQARMIVYDETARQNADTVDVDFYVFSSYYVPEHGEVRTEWERLLVSNTGRIAEAADEYMDYHFCDASEHILDGSLIIGRADGTLYTDFYNEGECVDGIIPLPALGPLLVDSIAYPSYRYAEGTGCSGDSTVAFSVKYYAPKDADSSFFVLDFELYPFLGVPTDLTIGYGIDIDVPDDSALWNNNSAYDASRNLIYQNGCYGISELRYQGVSSYGDALKNMFTWDNSDYVYPYGGFDPVTLLSEMETTVGYEVCEFACVNLSTIVTIATGLTLAETDTLHFGLILAGANPVCGPGPGGLDDLQSRVDRARRFVCDHVYPEAPHCFGEDCKCGDADENGIWNVSDAVFLISYIFGGGPRPSRPCYGDADGNMVVNISDAVYMIYYIFAGGAEPGGCDPTQEWPDAQPDQMSPDREEIPKESK